MSELRPDNVAAVARALREAHARRQRVAPVGGGTHAALARRAATVDVELHTTALDSVVEYEHEDMVVSVQAGMTAATLSNLLADRGCRVPLDVEKPDRATIGGIAAVGWTGPRRFGLGTLRDLLIGARAVLADGTLVKTGGMVVKNVSGYDVTKLLHGSLGSLGVIVEVNLKVLPLPAAEAVLTFAMRRMSDALAVASALLAVRLPFVAIDVASDGSVAAGCEGHAKDVARLCAAAREAAARFGGRLASSAEGAQATASAWRARIGERFGEDSATFRIVSSPSRIAGASASAEKIARACGYDPCWRSDVGCGLVELSIDSSQAPDGLARLERSLIDEFRAVRVTRCPQRLRGALAIYGSPPPGLALMRALKAQFDPDGVLNAGANVGGI